MERVGGIDMIDIPSLLIGKAMGGGGGGGGAVDPEADVRFFDPYDGSIVASYSAADFANLSALPANPTHEGMTSQGWNWTLADAKEQVAWAGFLDIGQQYVPTDGKTHVHVHMVDGALSPKMKLSIKGTATVNWGDNTADDSQTNTGSSYADKTFSHTYAAPGDYDVTIDGDDYKIIGSSYGSSLISGLNNSSNANANYNICITRIELGDNVTFGNYAFYTCRNLNYATLPNSIKFDGTNVFSETGIRLVSVPSGITSLPNSTFYFARALSAVSCPKSLVSFGSGFFQGSPIERTPYPKAVSKLSGNGCASCVGLKRIALPTGVSTISSSFLSGSGGFFEKVVVPSGVTDIGTSAFSCNYMLKTVELPNGLLTIGENAFNSCFALQEITFPSTLTTIGRQSFGSCYSLSYLEIPASVTSLGYSFCSGARLGKIKFLGSTPPTVASGAFNSLPTDCKILVPAGSLAAYTGTSNMPSSSSYTYEEY